MHGMAKIANYRKSNKFISDTIILLTRVMQRKSTTDLHLHCVGYIGFNIASIGNREHRK
jgi:hypothetical protein